MFQLKVFNVLLKTETAYCAWLYYETLTIHIEFFAVMVTFVLVSQTTLDSHFRQYLGSDSQQTSW